MKLRSSFCRNIELEIEQEHDSVYEALKGFATAFAIEKYAQIVKTFLKNIRENEARAWTSSFVC